MKTAGLVLILCSAFLLGLKSVDSRQRAALAMGDFSSMLTLLSGELKSSAQTLPELLLAIRPRTRGKASAFVALLSARMDRLGEERFDSLWQDALRQTSAGLPADVLDELGKLGAVLGRYDAQTQCREMDSCASVLREKELKLKSELPQYRRLVFGLLLTGGGMIGLVLI